jgi:hypothetical protein
LLRLILLLLEIILWPAVDRNKQRYTTPINGGDSLESRTQHFFRIFQKAR